MRGGEDAGGRTNVDAIAHLLDLTGLPKDAKSSSEEEIFETRAASYEFFLGGGLSFRLPVRSCPGGGGVLPLPSLTTPSSIVVSILSVQSRGGPYSGFSLLMTEEGEEGVTSPEPPAMWRTRALQRRKKKEGERWEK